MTDIIFHDCEYRYTKDNELYCKNKQESENHCDNCQENIHLNCENYNPAKDLCLKWFEFNVSKLKECKEKRVFSDENLQKKWSN